MERFDVAIVGAGAAGLAAAAELRHRHRVVVLEARGRIGGRIFTRRDPRVPVPIELGAEFIHGMARSTTRVLEEAGLAACEITGEHWAAERGRIRRAEYLRPIARVLRRIDPQDPDRSFADFIATRPGGRSLARDRAAALEFVEGFHAADPGRIGVRSIALEAGESPSASVGRIARVAPGYDRIPAHFARGLGGSIRLSAVVTAIEWERGRAELAFRRRSGRTARLAARAVIVTAPLGVLQAPPSEPGGIAISPDPPRIRDALQRLFMGAVTRVIFQFREPPWKTLPDAAKLDCMSFLHARGTPIHVWWTAFPFRVPLAVAWSGGPAAARAGRTSDEVVHTALESLAAALGVTRRRVEARVDRHWFHDWRRDPFARGAYSYVGVGGLGAARALARPVEDTLFFAGEATHPEASGTVEGAIDTGWRAARQVARALERRVRGRRR